MSNATDTIGCVSHRQHSRFFVMYEDFRDVGRKASGKEHEHKLAAFWRVLETKLNERLSTIPEIVEDCKKREVPIPEEHLWIELTYNDFVARSQGLYKVSSFQVASAESERLGFSKSRAMKRPVNPSEPDGAQTDYKEYIFFADVMQSVLDGGALPPPVEINSPLLKAISVRKEKKKALRAVEKNSPPLLKKTAPPVEINNNSNIDNNTNKNNKNIDYVEERTDASATASAAPTPFSSQQQQAEQIHIAPSKQEANEKAGQHGLSDRANNSHDNHTGRTSVQEVQQQEVVDENNSHSHSERTQANSVGVVPHGRAKEIEPEEQKTPPKPRRTPPVHKDGVPTPERIEQVFVCMEGTIRRLTEQEDFTFGRTKKAKEAIKDLLQGRTVSQEKMDWHIVRLWHKPKDTKTGFWWRENMSVVAICNNYDREIVNYKPPRKVGTSTLPERTVSGKARFEVPDDILDAMIAAGGGY